MGYEGAAVVMVSQLLKRSNVSAFVECKPVWIPYREKDLPSCFSKNFRAKDEMLVTFERPHLAGSVSRRSELAIRQTLWNRPPA